ncbi:MAG: RNA polymerase sigma factor [bacterium]|nr:RNA polymerase sigma factor [bacterium]
MSSDEEIYLKHRDELTRYATALVGRDGAADVVSTVVTKVLRSRRGLADLREPRPYLMRAVLNESLRYRKKNWREPPMGMGVGAVESRPEVLEAVVALPPKQRAAVYLAYWADLPSRQAAELMGCRPATVRRYLHLAKQKLREALNGNA